MQLLGRHTRSVHYRGSAPTTRVRQHAGRGCRRSEQPRRAQVLATLSRWVDEVPPSTQSLRYGNPAYRVWAARAAAAAEGFMERVLGPDLAPLAPELAPYLPGALGNAQRIDYGTGHETAFAALLFCLARAGAVRCRWDAFDVRPAALAAPA
jgi:hypothetical protein